MDTSRFDVSIQAPRGLDNAAPSAAPSPYSAVSTGPAASLVAKPAALASDIRGPLPIVPLRDLPEYRRPSAQALRWRLDANEGARLADLDGRGLLTGVTLCRYPSAAGLEARLAREFGLEARELLVTAGADDALLRACLAYLGAGRSALVASPSFEMLTRYIALSGAELLSVPELGGSFPIDGLVRAALAAGPSLGLIAVVSPNNPTGSVASAADLARLSAAAPQALLLVDLAYNEYAELDLTRAALELPNAIVVRTFSKAWGLASARVGYVLGNERLIAPLRSAGNPYAVAGPSLALAEQRLEFDRGAMQAHVQRVRQERIAIAAALRARGADALDSQANFVLARVPDPALFAAVAAERGLALRTFGARPGLEQAVRIGCPDDPQALLALESAIDAALAPEALIFDMDGVLADVSLSQVAAIQAAGRCFGLEFSVGEIAALQLAGDANCDWELTRRLAAARGSGISLDQAREAYEAAYQGGLFKLESAPLPAEWLRGLSSRLPLAIVTGRPRQDAQRFLETEGLLGCFRAVIAREDAARKPAPDGIQLALSRLGVRRAWMFGDTPDDLRAARAAGVVPIGVIAPGCPVPEQSALALRAARAAALLKSPLELPECLAVWLPKA